MAKLSTAINSSSDPVTDSDSRTDESTSSDQGSAGSDGTQFDGIGNEYTEPDINSGKPTGKRGRPRGQRTGNATGGASGGQKVTQLAVKKLAQQIEGAHQIASLLVGDKNPELAACITIDSNQAAALAESIAQVMSHYALDINPQMAAWLNLGVTATMVYGPQVMLYRQMKGY